MTTPRQRRRSPERKLAAGAQAIAAKHRAQYRQIDMRDWLWWLDTTSQTARAAGDEHRRNFTITTESLTWHALHARMLAAGYHELHDAPLFRAAKETYLRVECETARGFAPTDEPMGAML